MKVTELRHGNWVYFKPDALNVQVDNLPYGATLTGFEPIPLTPEILEKAGFVLHPWGWVIIAPNDFGIRLNVKSFNYEVSGNSPVKINYVHQLQNLFYALTGTELEIKL